jgi:hypothetical protein
MSRKRNAGQKRKPPEGARLVILARPTEVSSSSLLVAPPVPRRSLELRLQSGASLPNIEVPSDHKGREPQPVREPFVPATPSGAQTAPLSDTAISGSFAAFCARGEELEREHLEGWAEGESSPKVARHPPPTKRRASLRWVAGLVLAGAVTLLVSGGVKAAGHYRARLSSFAPPRKAPTAVVATLAAQQPKATEPAPPPQPTVEAQPIEPVASAAPDVEKPSGATQRKEAERLLNMGRVKDAIPIAEAAIEADPDHATGYLLLGSALQSAGRWKDGIAAYSQCVHRATKGPVNECRAVGGH